MEEIRRGIFTMHTEGGCYGVARWLHCCAGILAEGVVWCMTSGAIDPLQSDSYPQSSAALHLSIQTHTHRWSAALCSAVGKLCVFFFLLLFCVWVKKKKTWVGWINLNKSACVNWTLNNKFADENSTLAPAEVKQDAAPKPSTDVTHILLCFEGAHYAKITFERICAAGEISAIERNRKVLLLELRWEEEEESRSLGQQVSEAQMTSQLYNLCSPAYKTAAPHFRELQQLVPAR